MLYDYRKRDERERGLIVEDFIIELSRVEGVHGPRTLHVFVVHTD